MNIIRRIIITALGMTAVAVQLQAVSIVPQPTVMRENGSTVLIPSDRLDVWAGDKSLDRVISVWSEFMKKSYSPGTEELPTGFTRIVSETVLPEVKTAGNEDKANVRLYLDPSLAEEEYAMEVSGNGVTIKGGTVKGVWWGLQSLGQVLIQAAEISSPGEPLVMPGLSVQDKPHFSYRGTHFDPCRHFFTVDELKKFIDIMALHKLNTLHWHLTDDQGWRLEIKEYPLLTEVGAVRKETKVGHYNDVAAGYDGIPYGEGCWYSRQDVREIVEYAADRQITVIL